MISLIKKIGRTALGIKIRSLSGFKPIQFNLNFINKSLSVSDAFCWRTDNNFKTFFKFTDLLKFFYNTQDTAVDLIFYNYKNIKIKEYRISNLKLSNEIIIDKEFLGGIEDYGTFYIYHNKIEEIKKKIIISNRCYVGFSKNDQLPSFLHGNTLVSYVKNNENNVVKDKMIINTSIFMNQIYRIQNYFHKLDKVELFFCNPSSTKIKFKINNIFQSLNTGHSIIINATNFDHINIRSNCHFLRPLIFSYKKNFIDVYHG